MGWETSRREAGGPTRNKRFSEEQIRLAAANPYAQLRAKEMRASEARTLYLARLLQRQLGSCTPTIDRRRRAKLRRWSSQTHPIDFG